jgi:N-acetylglucosamine-6-sulfatase
MRSLALAGLALACAFGLASCEFQEEEDPEKPNIVVVITDDQTLEQLSARSMPFVHRFLEEGATYFADAIVTTPFCCPSRASFLTGQYVHNNGAFTSYKDFRRRRDTLATWLDFAGYRTALLGKYLNQYEKFAPSETAPAPGWDQWHMLLEPLSYYDYDVAVNGERVHRGTRPRDYSTTYLNRQAVKLVERWAPEDPPFFMWLAPHAPHDEKGKSGGDCSGRAVPAPGDLEGFRNAAAPDAPSVDERDVSDKPEFIQELDAINRQDAELIEHLYRCRLASLREVDRGVHAIADALREEDELDDTVIVVTSDNGLFHGEHRIRDSKRLPYAEALRVPLLARVPGDVAGGEPVERVAQPVANIDLAPTLLDLAGAPPCRAADACQVMDGRSLVPLLLGRTAKWPGDRGRLIEMRKCNWRGVLADDQAVVHYRSVPRQAGTRGCEAADVWERYELEDDPYQLRNLARGEADIPGALVGRLGKLERCAGIAGRDPAPAAGSSYCE